VTSNRQLTGRQTAYDTKKMGNIDKGESACAKAISADTKCGRLHTQHSRHLFWILIWKSTCEHTQLNKSRQPYWLVTNTLTDWLTDWVTFLLISTFISTKQAVQCRVGLLNFDSICWEERKISGFQWILVGEVWSSTLRLRLASKRCIIHLQSVQCNRIRSKSVYSRLLV